MTPRAVGGYANIGTVDDVTGWTADPTVTGEPDAAAATQWLRLGARVIGGCCGTTPEHTAALRGLLDAGPPAAPHLGATVAGPDDRVHVGPQSSA